ncbi:MAG TPA: ATP-binding protein [Candidatus Kapabacteria bacterium]|nr:ATP-binding protein [Candidatus Kapabacteria bacterium]
MSHDSRILLSRDVPSSREELTLLPRLLEGLREQCVMSDTQFFNLVVAVTEAVNNAIEHGNRLDPARRVHYSLECMADGVRCVVEDEGEGFVVDDLADPISPENIMMEGGRGIFLIRALMRSFHAERTEHGMRIEFECARE